MSQNPFDPPVHTEQTSSRSTNIAALWVAIPYLVPLPIMATMMNESGWYGTGLSGYLQGVLRVILFGIGLGAAYYALFRGSKRQKLAAVPAVLAYKALIVSIIWYGYFV